MRFGMFDQSEQPGDMDPAALYESRMTLVERAEQAGFWGYHKSEHHMIPLDHAPSVGLFLASLAQRTSRIRLCSLVHLLPFYHPLRLYEEICMLDHLSNGRLEVGFGKGISAPEHNLWGLDPAVAIERTDEMLDLLLQAFQCADESFSFDGAHYQLADVPLELGPRQQPYPPLWRPGTLDVAAELGVSTVVAGPTAGVHSALARYRELQQPGLSGGRETTVGVLRKFIIAPTEAEADRLGRSAWAAYTHNLGLLFRRYDLPIPNDPTVGGDYDLAKELNVVVVGTPQMIRDHYDEVAASELVDYVIGSFAFGNLCHDDALRSLELFSEHIVASAS